MSSFELDSRLAADSHLIAEGPLSQLRLMDDARFAWLVLVPRLPGACELVDLDPAVQHLLVDEITQAGRLLRACSPCDKLNVGALGNIVRQLHVHVLARTVNDVAWPGPVWGAGSMQRLPPESRDARIRQLRENLLPEFWRPA